MFLVSRVVGGGGWRRFLERYGQKWFTISYSDGFLMPAINCRASSVPIVTRALLTLHCLRTLCPEAHIVTGSD